MNLSNFEKYIETKIIQRGLDYFQEGHILALQEIADNEWQADVEGTDEYEVNVKVEVDGTILDSYCTCPYDMGNYCKHEVAVFFAIQEQQHDKRIKVDRSLLHQLLQKKPKEELIELILKLAKSNPQLQRELLLEVVPNENKNNNENELEEARRVIQHYISQAEDRSGYISWDDVDDALRGGDEVLHKARGYMNDYNFEQAIYLCLIVLDETIEMLDNADDSSGFIGSVIEESLSLINVAVWQGIENWNDNDKEHIYNAIMKEAANYACSEWSEWGFQLIEIGMSFCSDVVFAEKMEDLLEKLLSKIPNDSWSQQYNRKAIKELQFRMIAQRGDSKEINQFLMDNLDNSNIREIAIQRAFDEKDWNTVLHLSKQGEKVDQEYAGLVTKWKEYQYQAYEQLEDKDSMKKLAFALLLDGDFDYYAKLKKLYLVSEWPSFLEDLYAAFHEKKYQSSTYLKILIEEQDHVRLLQSCQQDLRLIEDLYPYLINEHVAEVQAIFSDHIQNQAQLAQNRSQYRKVCSIISLSKRACGSEYAEEIKGKLKQLYPKRPALLDELGKV